MMKYRYDAFISYRHKELDKFAAENLHRQMEAFRLPGKLSGRTEGRTRISRVFRDRDELPLTNSLEDNITEALRQSEYLVVICSPRLKESLWCRKEIETFIGMHGRKNVFAVLIEGEPEDSFPEELLYEEETIQHPDGTAETVRRQLEPLAADIRGRTKREMLKALRTEKLRLLAPMFSLNYDDLRQRHRERRLKRILAASLAAAAVCLCFGTFSTYMALRIQRQKEQLEAQAVTLEEQAAEIAVQNDALLENQARTLAAEALRLLEQGDRIQAIETAASALTEYEGMALPYTPEAQYALTESLHVYDNGNYIKAQRQLKTAGVICNMALSPNGEKLLTYDESGTLTLWDLVTGRELLARTDCDRAIGGNDTFTFLSGHRFAYEDRSGGVIICDMDTGEVFPFLEKVLPTELVSDPEGDYLAVKSLGQVRVFFGDSLEEIGSYQADTPYASLGELFFGKEEPLLVFQAPVSGEEDRDEEKLIFWELSTGERWETPAGIYRVADVEIVGDIAYVLDNYTGEDYDYFRARLTAWDLIAHEIIWSSTYENCRGSNIMRPYAQGADKLLLVTSQETRLTGMADGQEYMRFPLGSSVAGGAVSTGSDLFFVYTRSGELHTVMVSNMTDVVIKDQFQSHSTNVREFLPSAEGFLVLPYQDNSMTIYDHSQNQDFVLQEDVVELPEEEYMQMSEAVEFAREMGLQEPELTEVLFYSQDGSLLYASYSNGVCRIYDGTDFSLEGSFEIQSPNLRRDLGTDSRGNHYVCGISYGYMLSPDFQLLGVIENLVALDAEQDRLIVQRSGEGQYAISVYTPEELLAKARESVL
ncbi:MAG: TIR domain-containing protein [Eubacterium sp.]|nr:TIR domain-containing protein [Eubacterium sp.]MCM1343190.1 TIR domain-containing protein [Muribaculaceae bacterium]